MTADTILKQYGLSSTESRKAILQIFLKSNSALEHSTIEKKTKEQFDRVTIYRTLQTFQKSGIIHIIPSTDNLVRYALCKDECGEGHHHDHHIHFVCDGCGVTYCLQNLSVPEVKLPKGFTTNA
ncbi:MAG: transcriptional repressor, partial [Bacteroidota bacterium]|nr:transcriptional repressor [Bacteroidota bacterium]